MQSIGGGVWLSTMVSLDALGLDVDKYKLNMRVIGDTGTQTQALLTGNIDAAMLPYSYAEAAKRAGARSLADVGALKVVYQATVMCSLKDSSSVTLETMIALAKGLIESLIYILEPANRREVARDTQKKSPPGKGRRCRSVSSRRAIADAQRRNRAQSGCLENRPAPGGAHQSEGSRSRPRSGDRLSVAQNLETSGFLPEMRKRIPR